MISKLMVDGLWFFEIDVPIYAQDDRRHETMIDRKSVKTDQATNGGGCHARLQITAALFALATIGARINSRHDFVMLISVYSNFCYYDDG